MLLTCPECSTQYTVSDDAVGADGRKVRCIKCKHVWFQKSAKKIEKAVELPTHEVDEAEDDTFDDFTDIDFDETDAKDDSSLDSSDEPNRNTGWKIASLVLTVCLVFLLSLTYREALYSKAPTYYHMLGYYPTDKIVLANISIKPLESRRKERFEIGCIILNSGPESQPQPPLAMRIISPGGSILAEEDAYIEAGDTPIEAGGHVDCGTLEVTHGFHTAEKLMLEVASPLEMGLRESWNPSHKITHLLKSPPVYDH